MKNALLLLLGLSLTSAAFAQTAPRPARELIDEGIRLYDAGKYDEALARYQQVLAAEPANTTALSELALTYNALDRNAEAAAICEKLIKANPRVDPSVYVTYGNSLDGLKKPKEAVRIYEQGLKYFPDSYSLYFNAGVAQARNGQLPASIGSFQQAITLNPNHASSHMSLGVMQTASQHRIPGLLSLSRFLILEPRSARSVQRLPMLDKAMELGVARTGENAITINVSSAALAGSNGKESGPDNFGPAEMLLSISSATMLDKSLNKDVPPPATPIERFVRQFDSLCEGLGELGENQKGFTWNYYVPYFVEMQKKGFVPAFAYLAHASQTQVPEVQQWLAAHPNEVAVFQEWSKNYVWPKPLK
ncbi:tetratricopeptide repeat protein [Hymenobacter sp. DH14]|uniref:Tetratricopeptide repeat protein n=1 Tax=Hymenobacter cyanobacteriorum TaxID=2926463 RepID=A0A9X2AFT5_9BACT|nr:tetratricopeptide repeat protein [Hymenobacter cyanobacteriorum]MCI1186878.1 tetratricopeptide repeat protein [Hymenobacter cyanobacteriorum]